MAQERGDLELRNNTEIDGVDDTVRPEALEMTGDEAVEEQSNDDSSDETDKIKAKIEETRAELGETIDAIQEKLSFSNISGQVSEQVNQAVETAKEAVYDATIGKVVNIMKNLGTEVSATSFGRTIKNNPLPFILIGAGVGMLAYNSYSSDSGRSSRNRGRNLTNRQDRQIGEGGDATSEGGRLGTVTDAVTGVKDSVSSAAGTAYEKVTGAVDQVYNKAGEYGSTAREQYDHYLEENPLAVGAVALALGAAVGMAIPATRYEGKLMGQARQELFNKAQDTASNLLHETRQTMGDASQSIADKVGATTH